MEPIQQPVTTLGDWLTLHGDAQAAEALLTDVQIDPADLGTYWAMSAELLSLLQEVEAHLEEWRRSGPRDDEGDRYLRMRRRLVAVLARAEEIGIEQDEE